LRTLYTYHAKWPGQVIATREAKRNNPTYRPHGLVALGGVARARKDVDFMPDALNIVSRVLDEVTDADTDSMDIDSGSGHNSKYVYKTCSPFSVYFRLFKLSNRCLTLKQTNFRRYAGGLCEVSL
jgi:hypothetical protein